jgi:hypothetical protein
MREEGRGEERRGEERGGEGYAPTPYDRRSRIPRIYTCATITNTMIDYLDPNAHTGSGIAREGYMGLPCTHTHTYTHTHIHTYT